MTDTGNFISKDRKYYIYGIGKMGISCYNRIANEIGSDFIEGFIETHPGADECNNKKVFSPEEVKKGENIYAVISSFVYGEEMKQNLRDHGFDDEHFIDIDEVFGGLRVLSDSGLKRPVKKLCFWPPVEKNDEILIKKISWYIPDRVEVSICCIPEIRNSFRENVKFAEKENMDTEFRNADVIFLWDASRSYTELKDYSDKIYAVDPFFHSGVELRNYSQIYYFSLSDEELNAVKARSGGNFALLREKAKKKKFASVFGSGPSVNEILDEDFSESFNIMCNGLISRDDLFEKLDPGLFVFADDIFTSPIKYARDFMEKLIRKTAEHDMYIVLREHMIPLVDYYFPALKDRLIGLTEVTGQKTFPDENNLSVKLANNVMSVFVIPMASALSDEIRIAGCTGRNPEETGKFWSHSNNAALEFSEFDIMFPSVNRDFNVIKFEQMHNEYMEKIFEYGESLGKKYYNISTSYLSSLKKRTLKSE